MHSASWQAVCGFFTDVYESLDREDVKLKHIFEEMSHFFKVYKQLEGKDTVVNELAGPEEAKRIIADAIHHYNEVYGNRPREN